MHSIATKKKKIHFQKIFIQRKIVFIQRKSFDSGKTFRALLGPSGALWEFCAITLLSINKPCFAAQKKKEKVLILSGKLKS